MARDDPRSRQRTKRQPPPLAPPKAGRKPGLAPPSTDPFKLGEIALARRLVDDATVRDALSHQDGSTEDVPLGEILRRMGVLDDEEIRVLLKLQKKARQLYQESGATHQKDVDIAIQRVAQGQLRPQDLEQARLQHAAALLGGARVRLGDFLPTSGSGGVVRHVTCPECGARHGLEDPREGFGFSCKYCDQMVSWDGRRAEPVSQSSVGTASKFGAPPALDQVEALERLARLRETGMLSDQDFEVMKTRIIRGEAT